MATEVVMPQMGESIAEGTITKWLVAVGQTVERDQPLFEISTDKVDAEIPSPTAGVLLEIRHQAGETVPVHQVVGLIGAAGEAGAGAGQAASAVPAAPIPAPAPAAPMVAAAAPVPPAPAGGPAPAAAVAAEAGGPYDYDLVVLGSGPGGYVAAIRAAQLGMKVAVVEKDAKLGGTCLHRGCIPTKALLHTASLLDEIRKAGEFGIEVGAPAVDLLKAQIYKRRVVDKNAKGIEFLFRKNKIDGYHGRGRLTDAHAVAIAGGDGDKELTAKHILIATGSVVRDLKVAPADGQVIVNSDHLLELDRVPKSMIVLGAGAVGTELASIFAAFGTEVTLVEMLPRVLPIEDEEISKELERQLKKRKLRVLTGTLVQSVERADGGVKVVAQQGERAVTLSAEMMLVAVGRAPVAGDLGLEALGIVLERGYVQVNGLMQTALPHVYAIGDVVNTPWLAHVASAEGILAVEHMAGQAVEPLNYDRVPSCTYCEPEVASVGLSEAKARERGYDVAVGKFNFAALGKASILGKPEGFVKVVRDTRYDELLGVHIIGAHATDLIAEACVALRLEGTNEELFRTMHAHPTLSEAVMEAAHAASGHAIHG